MSAAPPSEADLQAKAGALKKGETKAQDGVHGVDPGVLAIYKKAFADGGGDKAKVCAALGLDESKWADGGEAPFLSKYLGVK